MKERIQKVLAQAGYGSRREIEKWIDAGRVSINNKIAVLGDKISYEDDIELDGKLLPLTDKSDLPTRVIAYYKPEGEVCSQHDPEGRPTVFEHLPRLQKSRWVMIGRLDLNTSGLLLFTTNGELANRLMHPRYEVEREYAVRVYGDVTQDHINNLLNGVQLEDGPAKFDEIKSEGGEGRNQWFHVKLREGRKREVRRLWESQDLTVSRLTRIRYGNVLLNRSLKLGKWHDLPPGLIKDLGTLVGLDINPYVKKIS